MSSNKLNWIPISKDNKPEYNTPVLVCEEDNEESIGLARLNATREYCDKDGVHLSFDWFEGRHSHDSWWHNVTHWCYISVKKK